MIKLCTVKEIRDAEKAALSATRTEQDLMVQAGTAFADLVLERHGSAQASALFLVGPGNNGGDGLVAASRLVEQGWECAIWTFNRDSLRDAPVPSYTTERFRLISDLDELRETMSSVDLIVDAVFGIGGRNELPDAVGEVFDWAHQARIDRGTPIWAVDVPSGVDADTGDAAEHALLADVTVMFGLPKIGLYQVPGLRFAGELVLVDIGLEAGELTSNDIGLITETSVRRMLPRRQRDTHKHEVGWLMVVGGAPNYVGAPRMAAEAAARAGAGMVCLAVPRSLVAPIASAVREVTFLPLPDAEFGGAGDRMAKLVREKQPDYAAMLIGPGMGQDDPVPEFMSRLFGLVPTARSIGFGALPSESTVESFSGRAVIDADGLNWLAKQDDWHESVREAELVLTPHPGELSRLTGASVETIVANPWQAARDAAERFGQVVILKHGFSVVAAPEEPLLIGPRTQPALASAGTGDVLAGIVAGMMAQGLTARDAAATGLFVGAMAAEIAVARTGTLSLVAGDVIEALPAALRTLYDKGW